MATTTNYAWETPDDTDLVKDGAAAIRTLGSSVDTTTKALNPSTTLGDIEYRSSTANTNTRLAIGSTGNVLTVAGGVPTWAAPAGGNTNPAFRAFRNSTGQSISASTATKVQFNGETFDTANCFDSTTNYRFTPNVAGYYQFTGAVEASSSSGGYIGVFIYKNGSRVATNRTTPYVSNSHQAQTTDLISMNGTTDYVEVFAFLNGGSGVTINAGSDETYFTGVWVRS